MSETTEVAIVGGGIIGLAIAWELAGRGKRVIVLEQGRVGGQASGAAAGLLAPATEQLEPAGFLGLGIASLRAYPTFCAEIQEGSGIDPELELSGVLRVAFDEPSAEQLNKLVGAGGLRSSLLTAADARQLEPGLGPDVVAGLLIHDEGHVHSPRLVEALGRAARRRGVVIREGTPVVGIVGRNGMTVESFDGTLTAETVIVAAGAWTGLFPEMRGAVFPVRGQIAAVKPGHTTIQRPVFAPGAYLVPKRDGSIAVGATEDQAGFADAPTLRGVRTILAGGERLAPALGDAAFVRAWAGLRPATPDLLPILGALAPGLVVASGHYRNGILLAPITARHIADLVLGLPSTADLAPFVPGRPALRNSSNLAR
ncbi:MAG: glycine oxidase ThiO [Dehalococcoidia bacterium]